MKLFSRTYFLSTNALLIQRTQNKVQSLLISWLLNFLVSWFLDLLASCFIGFFVSSFLGFDAVSSFLNFKNPFRLFETVLIPIVPHFHFMFFEPAHYSTFFKMFHLMFSGMILIPYSIFSKRNQTDLHICSSPAFSNVFKSLHVHVVDSIY